ncbi:MAG: PD-(D/E)XK nuclease family protein [Planctomycetes bacterium]|nr:PD-(D/E)XK nuclease family protein [Planctomycetota bacterium]
MSSIHRHFLGWDQPFLTEAANWLQEHYLQQKLGGNSNLLILVSGQEVGRRLQSILVGNAAKENRAIVLPPIETTSQCLERLMGTGEQIADPATTRIATASVLRSMHCEELHAIVGNRIPDENDSASWFALAEQICSAWSTLSGGGFSPQRSSWPEAAQGMLTEGAEQRIDALHYIQQQVQKMLQESGLHLLETKSMHLIDVSQEIDCQNYEHIVLVGTADLSGMVMKTIDRVRTAGVSVDVLIRAPESKADLFDEYGSVDVSSWSDESIDIPDECIQVAGSPSSQAAAVVRELSKTCDTYSADQVIVASTDEALVPIIQRHLSSHDIKNRFAGGNRVLTNPAAVLLRSVSQFLSKKTFSTYAALVRHTDIAKLLDLQEATLKSLDTYSMELVPDYVQATSWFVPNKKIRGIDSLVALHKKIFNLLETCTTLQESKADFATCSGAIRALLLEVYGDETLDRTDPKFVSLQKLFGVLDRFDTLPTSVSSNIGLLEVTSVIDLILSHVESLTIPEYPNVEAIETVGWLEAMAADAPCLIVVGMSANLVGGNNPGDAFFPDSLRGELGLETIDRRLARDAHAMKAMQSMRSDHGKLVWIVARQNTDGDPLTPSPLLLRCEDGKELAQRAKRLVVSLDREEPEVPKQFEPEQIGIGLPIPRPDEYVFDPVERISVTAFKDYIACPYRYWLKHVLRLKTVEDGGTELDPKLFGGLVHKTLEKFGCDSTIRDSSDEGEIKKSLSEFLDSVVQDMFGSNVSGAIRVQVELARFRLDEVAKHQAESVKEGWRILCSEKKLEKQVVVEGKPMTISGVIDRVDVHKDGRIRVLDYKTGGATANDAHFKKRDGEWIDFQLPLYRLLLSEIKELEGNDVSDGNVSLGYFRIGDQEATTGINLLDLPDEAMATVDDVITTFILDIANGKFGEVPTDPAPKYSDDFAWICQDNSITEEAEGDD